MSGEQEVVAYHEAAHAAVTVALGGGLTRVTIVPSVEARAAVHGDVYTPPKVIGAPTSDEVERLTKIARQLYAGVAAERRKYGPGHNVGGAQDFANIEQLGEQLYTDVDARGAWRGRAFRLAQEDVARLWPAVEEIAKELMSSGDRNEEDVRAVLQSHGLL